MCTHYVCGGLIVPRRIIDVRDDPSPLNNFNYCSVIKSHNIFEVFVFYMFTKHDGKNGDYIAN